MKVTGSKTNGLRVMTTRNERCTFRFGSLLYAYPVAVMACIYCAAYAV